MTKTILSILDELAATTKGTVKQEILQREKSNDLLQQVFKMALDPMISFWIKKIPEYTPQKTGYPLDMGIGDLKLLSSRAVTGNAAIVHLKETLEDMKADDAEVLARIIKRDLRCGVAIGLVNKVWGEDFIKEFPVMKASALDEKALARIKYPSYSQLKVDGLRCTAIKTGDSVTLYSAAGNEIELGNIGLVDELWEIMQDNFVLDGELVVVDSAGKVLPRKTGNGIINKAVRGTISEEEASRVRFMVFDCINRSKFETGTGDKTEYSVRYADLLALVVPTTKYVKVVLTKIVHSEAEAYDHFRELYRMGEEGTILKDMRSTWENKRSKLQIKFKGIISCDLRVVAVEEGTGKNKGKVGALVCETSDGLLRTNVGTGLNDNDRAQPFDYYVDKIVEVEYNELIQSKVAGALHALFLPRFVVVRTDKLHADSLAEIQKKAAA